MSPGLQSNRDHEFGVTHWPADASECDTATLSTTNVTGARRHTIHLSADRYKVFRCGRITRSASSNKARRRHHISANTHLPTQEVVLTAAENTARLTDVISSLVIQDSEWHKQAASHHEKWSHDSGYQSWW